MLIEKKTIIFYSIAIILNSTAIFHFLTSRAIIDCYYLFCFCIFFYFIIRVEYMPPTIGILGGGIAGLSSAYYLARKLALSKYPQARILLFERTPRFGGWIRTEQLGEKYESHLFESAARTLRLQTGLSATNSHSAVNTLKLLEDLNIFNEQFCPIEKNSPVNKNRLIFYKNNLINLNDLSVYFGGKPLSYPPIVYGLYEYFSDKRRLRVQDETVKSFLYRRFGDFLSEDIVEYLVDPLLKGVYAGNVDSLSARSIMKKFFELEQRHGSIIKGVLKNRKEKRKDDSIHHLFKDLNLKDYEKLFQKYSIYYLKDGMEVLAKNLVNQLETYPNVELIRNQTIQQIHFQENQLELTTRSNEKYQLDHLISAVPSFELAKYIQHDTLRSCLNRIPFVNMIVVNLLYRKQDIYPKEAFGYLIPSRENSHLLGVLFDTCVRYQTDKHKHGSQLTVMLGGAWYDQLRLGQFTDEQLLQIVSNELKKHMNLDEQPAVYSINRMNKAIPVKSNKKN